MGNPYESPSPVQPPPKRIARKDQARTWSYLFTLNYVWAVLLYLLVGIPQPSPLYWKVLTTAASAILIIATLRAWLRLKESWLLKLGRGIVVLPAVFVILATCLAYWRPDAYWELDTLYRSFTHNQCGR